MVVSWTVKRDITIESLGFEEVECRAVLVHCFLLLLAMMVV